MERILDPWSTELPADYKQIMKEFGIGEMTQDLAGRVPDCPLVRRKIIFAQRDFGRIVKAFEEKKPFAVMTGVKPTGTFHLGTATVAETVRFLQKDMRGKLFYSIADLEAYCDNGQPLEKSFEIAVDNVADLLAFGIDPRSTIYLQSRNQDVKNLGIMYGRNVTYNTISAIYGEKNFGLYMSAMTQVGDILYPQHVLGPIPTVVPVGIDQDPHIRLTRDIAAKHDLVLPSSVYFKFSRSLTGSAKMSKREPQGMISLNDAPEAAAKKMMSALTGGRATVEEQKKLGGEPAKCVVYENYAFFLQPDDKALRKVFEDCVSGRVMCGECKQKAAALLKEYLKAHQAKKKKLLGKAEKILQAGC